MFKFDAKKVPTKPGVYLYKNSEGEIIYIGKAINLRNRVKSYFQGRDLSAKTKVLVKHIAKIEFIVVENEVEALLLENKLIKKNKPKYNIDLKDDKTFAYIKISDDEIPQISNTRIVKEDKAIYYGPFTSGKARKDLYNLIVDIFNLVTPKTFNNKSKLNYQIGKAPAKSIKEIDKSIYSKNVEQAKQFLSGKYSEITKKLKNEMQKASKEKKYEYALELREKLKAIQFYKEKQNVDLIKNYDQNIVASKIINEKVKMIVINVSKGTILDKKIYNIDYGDDYFEEFLKAFYQNNVIPEEILVSEKFWLNDDEKNNLEKFFSKIKGKKTQIRNPMKGEKLKLIFLQE
jgi:excinuclease ABC subunit C